MITLKFSVLAQYCCILAGLFLISAREAAPHSYSDHSSGEPICITFDGHDIYLIGPDNKGNFILRAEKSTNSTQPDTDAYFFVILPDGNFTTLSKFDSTNQISTPFSKEIKLQYPAGLTSPLSAANIQAWSMKKNNPIPPKRPSESNGGATPKYQLSNGTDFQNINPPSGNYLASTYLEDTVSIKIGTSWSPWTHNDAYYYLIVSFANKTGNDQVSSGEVIISNCVQPDPTGFIMEEYFTCNPYDTNNSLNWPFSPVTQIPINTNADTIQFNNLKPGQEVRHIYIKMKKNGVARDSMALYKAEIKYKKGTEIINTLTKSTACKTIILGASPHDPNHKTVNQDSCTAKANGLLTYRIQFQNEGAGVARDVIIKDQLPSELFPYQIAVTQSSVRQQQLTTSVSNTGEATFTFSGIGLPGTAQTVPRMYDYNETIGWVEFSCTATCPEKGKSISNSADIIFVGNNGVAQPAITTKAINTKADTTAFPGWNIINSDSPCRPKHCCRIGWGRCKWYFCRFRECRTRKSANTIKSNY